MKRIFFSTFIHLAKNSIISQNVYADIKLLSLNFLDKRKYNLLPIFCAS
jgi:hypothetical protein